MKLLEPGRLLVGASKSTQLRILIMRAQKREADRGARPANLVVIAGIDGRRRRGVGAAEAVGHDHRRMAREIGDYELLAVRGSDDDIDLIEELRHLLDGQR